MSYPWRAKAGNWLLEAGLVDATLWMRKSVLPTPRNYVSALGAPRLQDHD